MSDRIPDFEIRMIIARAIGPHSCIHEAREQGVFLTPLRDRAIELALPLGTKLAQTRFNRLAGDTRLTFKDLEQAAACGVIQGIDRYKPSMDVLVSSHVTTWINREMGIEVDRNHWRSIKPSKTLRRAYLGKGMTDAERRAYEHEFCDFGHYLAGDSELQTLTNHGRMLSGAHRLQNE